jgi:predicted methyltransferase
MKPGAVLGIVDHAAARGAPQETGNTLHRIDPQLARSEIEKAGFVFEEAADMLHNANDDHSLNMADPAIRGRTDRFVMRFRKPG